MRTMKGAATDGFAAPSLSFQGEGFRNPAHRAGRGTTLTATLFGSAPIQFELDPALAGDKPPGNLLRA
jgi:hypothetical protein